MFLNSVIISPYLLEFFGALKNEPENWRVYG